jgi:hypothetical protein
MAVVVKLSGNDPKKGRGAKSAVAAKVARRNTGFRLPFGESDEWFCDRRLVIGIASGVVVAGLAWGLMAMQSTIDPLAGVKPSAAKASMTDEEADAKNAAAAKARAKTLAGGYDADPDNATTAPKVDPKAANADPNPDG